AAVAGPAPTRRRFALPRPLSHCLALRFRWFSRHGSVPPRGPSSAFSGAIHMPWCRLGFFCYSSLALFLYRLFLLVFCQTQNASISAKPSVALHPRTRRSRLAKSHRPARWSAPISLVLLPAAQRYTAITVLSTACGPRRRAWFEC